MTQLAYSTDELRQFVMDEYDAGRYCDGFFKVPDIGRDLDISGFAVKIKLVAREQTKNESVLMHGLRCPNTMYAPFMIKECVFDGLSGFAMEHNWVGVARTDRGGPASFVLVGMNGDERSYTPLLADNYKDALAEADSKEREQLDSRNKRANRP